MNRRLLISLIAVAVLLGVITLIYTTYGSARTAPAPAASAAEAPSSATVATEVTPESGAAADVPPPDPNSPSISDVPGCVCHSDDPKIVKAHAEYRMNQCIACHVGGVPTGQE